MISDTAMTDTNPIHINYTDARLRVLVEEYITQQRSAFTLQYYEDVQSLNGTLYQFYLR